MSSRPTTDKWEEDLNIRHSVRGPRTRAKAEAGSATPVLAASVLRVRSPTLREVWRLRERRRQRRGWRPRLGRSAPLSDTEVAPRIEAGPTGTQKFSGGPGIPGPLPSQRP
jgi:hypothetical protein